MRRLEILRNLNKQWSIFEGLDAARCAITGHAIA